MLFYFAVQIMSVGVALMAIELCEAPIQLSAFKTY